MHNIGNFGFGAGGLNLEDQWHFLGFPLSWIKGLSISMNTFHF